MARKVARRKRADAIIPKAPLAQQVARILAEEGMTQTEAAWRMRDAPSQVSLVATGKTEGFSAERLLRMLTRLGRDVDVILRPTPGKRAGRVRITIK